LLKPSWNLAGTALPGNFAGTLLEPFLNLPGNLAGTLLELCRNLACNLVGTCWNLPGTLLELCSMEPFSNLAGTLLVTFLESCWNLAGTLLEPSCTLLQHCCNIAATLLEPAGTFLTTLLQLPNSDPVGFQSLGRGVVSAKCTEQYWSLARTSLEYRWQTGQSLLEPCCKVAEI